MTVLGRACGSPRLSKYFVREWRLPTVRPASRGAAVVFDIAGRGGIEGDGRGVATGIIVGAADGELGALGPSAALAACIFSNSEVIRVFAAAFFDFDPAFDAAAPFFES